MAMAVSYPLYTVDELDRFPDDGNRYELLDGLLLVTPAPALAHQIVTNRMQVALSGVVDPSGIARVVGPGAVVRKPRTQLQPDVLVFPSKYSPRASWADIEDHWLAVEVLSRSSRMYDREFKRDAYLALGVREVWLVDWREEMVEVCRAGQAVERVTRAISWAPAPGVALSLELRDVFAGLD